MRSPPYCSLRLLARAPSFSPVDGARRTVVNGKEQGGMSNQVLFRNVNEHWITPLDSETPLMYRELEGGAYW